MAATAIPTETTPPEETPREETRSGQSRKVWARANAVESQAVAMEERGEDATEIRRVAVNVAEAASVLDLNDKSETVKVARERYERAVGYPGEPISQMPYGISGNPAYLRVVPGGWTVDHSGNVGKVTDRQVAEHWSPEVVKRLDKETELYQRQIDEAERRIIIKFEGQRNAGHGRSETDKIDLSVRYDGDPSDAGLDAKAARIHTAALAQAADRIKAATEKDGLHVDTGSPLVATQRVGEERRGLRKENIQEEKMTPESTVRVGRDAQAERESREASQQSQRSSSLMETLRSGWSRLVGSSDGHSASPIANGDTERETPQRRPNRPTETQISEAIREAQQQRHSRVADLMERPGVETEREARKLLRAGARREWVVNLIPEKVREYFGVHKKAEGEKAIVSAYEKLVDRKADKLLQGQEKAQRILANVDPNVPLHRLNAKQYRAAETFIENEKQLKALRPLSSEDYRQALAESGNRSATTQSQAPRIAPVEVIAQRVAEQESRQAVQPEAPKQSEAISEAQRSQQNREKALAAVREIQSGINPDGYRTEAQKAMASRIVAQLNEGRDTLNLSVKYSGGEQAKATESHARAIQENMPLIEAVRNAGIPVDTGKATVVQPQKKSEQPGASEAEGIAIGAA